MDFVRHDCRIAGVADSLDYTRTDGTKGDVSFDVFCSIILPADPDDWNGSIALEPVDSLLADPPPIGEFVGPILLTNEFLLGTDFERDDDDDDDRDDDGDDGRDEDDDGDDDDGASDHVVGIGFSNSGSALRGTMALAGDFGQAPFDNAMIMVTAQQDVPDPTNTILDSGFGPVDFGTQRAIFLNSETEVIANGTFDGTGFVPTASTIPLRVETDDIDRFVYEMAGASHIDATLQEENVAIGLIPPGTFADSNPLRWTPIMRGVFSLLDTWLATGETPPGSRLLQDYTGPPPDPTLPTRVIRASSTRSSNVT